VGERQMDVKREIIQKGGSSLGKGAEDKKEKGGDKRKSKE
jgi:hypothetical protein